MTVIVYGDFSSARCYLAARRADALIAAGQPVDFRVVESQPDRPVSGTQLSPVDRDDLRAEFAALTQLLLPGEELPWTLPPIVPKTEAAVSAYGGVYDSAAANDVRRLLFELYWRDGLDIGSPNALRSPLVGPVLRAGSCVDPLRQFGYAVSVDRGPITTAAYRRISSWRGEWTELGRPDLPVVLIDGSVQVGVDAVRRLGTEIADAGVDPAPVLDDPRRYPAVRVRPPATWVSEIGGRLRYAYRALPAEGERRKALTAASARPRQRGQQTDLSLCQASGGAPAQPDRQRGAGQQADRDRGPLPAGEQHEQGRRGGQRDHEKRDVHLERPGRRRIARFVDRLHEYQRCVRRHADSAAEQRD